MVAYVFLDRPQWQQAVTRIVASSHLAPRVAFGDTTEQGTLLRIRTSVARAFRVAKQGPAPEASGLAAELARCALRYMRLVREVEERIERRLYM
jgi:hypothetical protein